MTADALAEAPLPALLRGSPGARARILQNCRLEGGGIAAYGRDQIMALFDKARLRPGDDARLLAGERLQAVIAPQSGIALFGEVHGGFVGRIWICAAAPIGVARLERVDVPFDLDMDQRGPTLAFDPADHPGLDRANADAVSRCAAALLVPARAAGLADPRAIVLRAFSTAEATAALIVVQGRGGGGRPYLLRRDAIAIVPHDGGEPLVMPDQAGLDQALTQAWRPRL